MIYLSRYLQYFEKHKCSTSLPGGNQVDGLPHAPVLVVDGHFEKKQWKKLPNIEFDIFRIIRYLNDLFVSKKEANNFFDKVINKNKLEYEMVNLLIYKRLPKSL